MQPILSANCPIQTIPSKLNALFHELNETGSAEKMGLSNPADLVECYPKFFWSAVEPFIGDGLRYLCMTTEGKRWVATLFGNVSWLSITG